MESADLVFAPTLACWNVCYPVIFLSLLVLSVLYRQVLLLSRTMLSIRFDTLCGSFCLRLASTCNHRPDHARFIIIKFSHSRCQPQKKGCHKTIMVSRQSLTCSRRAINKPSSVRFHAMIIYLVKRLPVCSSDSTRKVGGQLHPFPIRSYFGWGLPSQPVS